jgi:hypothetical protein
MHVLLIGDTDALISQVRWAQEFYGATYLILEVAQRRWAASIRNAIAGAFRETGDAGVSWW